MGIVLNKNSLMECPRHGDRKPTFICKHLRDEQGQGFHQSDDTVDEDWPFQYAWCDECNQILQEEDGWNDRSEEFAQIVAICEGCFEDIKTGKTGE